MFNLKVGPRAGAMVAPVLLALVACSSGGGGGGGASAKGGVLLTLRFPDPSDQNPGPEGAPPQNASLVQRVIFRFSESPNPSEVSLQTLPIRDELGFPVRGAYHVNGPVVTFTPQLPTRPLVALDEETFDTGGAGLAPGSSYTIRVSASRWRFLEGISEELRRFHQDPVDPQGILLSFRTTEDPQLFFTGLDPVDPQLVDVSPADGAADVSPWLHEDPDALFSEPRPFQLTFDRPLNPALTNVSDLTFQLIDLDDRPQGFPLGLPLGATVRILTNTIERSVVELTPSGVLPFGHLLDLEYPQDLKGLSQGEVTGGARRVAAMFTTADTERETVRDRVSEDFDEVGGRAAPEPLALGSAPAEWDREDSDILQAAFAFEGTGELGRFIPTAPPNGETRTIVLDTSRQVFPLLDGSTPDAPPGFEVVGGVFNFSEIVVPRGIVIRPRGPNPLVFTVTGGVDFDGTVELVGANGTNDSSFDSAVAPMPGGPGGAGGGRGGDAHPTVYWPPDQLNLLNMFTPYQGESGWGPRNEEQIGGEGGEGGTLDHPNSRGKYGKDREINCAELSDKNNNDDRAAGGGGGSLLTRGGRGRIGRGNVVPIDGAYHIRTPEEDGEKFERLSGGRWGKAPFSDDGDPHNDFFGVRGQQPEPFGGQGGGGGGSRMEAYYCGVWCKHDADTKNDRVCLGGEFGDPPKFADTVSDARGGGGGGGGGMLLVKALGPIVVRGSAFINARGGRGGGGEVLGNSKWGGPGGGGSGGSIILMSGDSVEVQASARIDVRPFADRRGGEGGLGIVQVQSPVGTVPVVQGDIEPPESWVDPQNERNPAEFSAISTAVSRWVDMGRTIARPPAGTNPLYSFLGTDSSGYVRTDEAGNVLDPDLIDLRVDFLGGRRDRNGSFAEGEEPRANWIPPNATVRVEFQAADAIAPGSREVDPGSLLPGTDQWSPRPDVAHGHQFVRWRVTFDIARRPEDVLGPDLLRPAVQWIRLHSEF